MPPRPTTTANPPSPVEDAKTHFAVAAGSLTSLYKLAYAGAAGCVSSSAARDEVRAFANMAAMEVPSAAERLRGRRFVPLDELLAFLDRADERQGQTCQYAAHCFGRKRHSDATPPPDRVAVSAAATTNITHTGSEGEGPPLQRRHRSGDAHRSRPPASS